MGNTICKDNIQLYSEAYHVDTYKASCPFAHNDGKWVSDTICRSVVRFTPWALHLQGHSTWYPLNKRLGGLKHHCWHLGDKKNFSLVTARYQTSIPWSSSLYPSHYTNYSILAHLWVLINSKNYTFQTGKYFISIKYMKQFILMYCK